MSGELRPGIHRIPDSGVPAGWRAVQLASVATNVAGGRLGLTKQSDYRPSGVPAFSAAGQDGFVERVEFRATSGVVLSAIGANCGRTFLAEGDWTTLANTQAIIPNDELEARFLHYRTNREDFWPRSGSAQPFIKPSSIGKCWLMLPPLPEQRRIAEILDTLDEAIRKTEQVIAKLQQMKQGLLHDLLTRGIDEHGELRDPERHPEQFKDSPLGRIPRGWEVVQAGEHVNFNGGFGFPHVFQGRHTGELPFYKVSDQSLPGNERWLYGANNYVSRSLASRQGWRPAPAEGVAFAKVGAALLLNRRRILTRDSLVDNNMMVAVAEPDVAPAWLYWWLTTVDFGVFVQPGALPSVNQGQLNRLELALPGLAEQTEIGRRLNAASVREVEEEKGLDKLRTLKHGLMDDLLTGRVRVTVPLEATA